MGSSFPGAGNRNTYQQCAAAAKSLGDGRATAAVCRGGGGGGDGGGGGVSISGRGSGVVVFSVLKCGVVT